MSFYTILSTYTVYSGENDGGYFYTSIFANLKKKMQHCKTKRRFRNLKQNKEMYMTRSHEIEISQRIPVKNIWSVFIHNVVLNNLERIEFAPTNSGTISVK